MLTYNLNTSDGLTNGALREVVGYDISPEGRIQRIYVQFFDDKKEIISKFIDKISW